jgi:hypothetical protein
MSQKTPIRMIEPLVGYGSVSDIRYSFPPTTIDDGKTPQREMSDMLEMKRRYKNIPSPFNFLINPKGEVIRCIYRQYLSTRVE